MPIPNVIEKIKICCIKKCDENCCEYDFKMMDKNGHGLLPNKLNVLYAPNGEGKSTLSQSFRLIQENKTKIKLKKERYYLLHNMKEECINNFSIEIEALLNNGKLLCKSDINKNDIKNFFLIFSINNNLNVKAKRHQYRGASANMIIDKINLIEAIPDKITFNQIYDKNLLDNNKIRCNKKSLEKYILDNLELIENNIINIFKNYKKNQFKRLQENHSSEQQEFFCIFLLYSNNKSVFMKYLQYLKYQLFKKRAQYILNQLKTFNFELKFKNGIVEFPKDANLISNGQRDVLVFISNLLKVEWEILYQLQNKPGILIIDEVFDYLDDANFLVAQYYLTELIQKIKKSGKVLFTLLLTHLSPIHFKHFYFQRKKIKKEFFLMPQPSINPLIEEIVKKRNSSEKGSEEYNGYSKLLHFNEDKKYKYESYNYNKILEEINKEFNKYLNNDETYCPISVCLYLRIKIEEEAFLILRESHPESIFDFLEKHTTIDKLKILNNLGVKVPESWFLLSAIYNDYLHNESNKFLLYKLNNLVIKNIIIENFGEENVEN